MPADIWKQHDGNSFLLLFQLDLNGLSHSLSEHLLHYAQWLLSYVD